MPLLKELSRRRFSSLPLQTWAHARPVSCQFVSICQVQHSCFIPRLTDDLKPEGQTIPIETARDADCRQAVIVGKNGVGGRQSLRILARFLYGWNGGDGRRKNKDIDVVKRIGKIDLRSVSILLVSFTGW